MYHYYATLAWLRGIFCKHIYYKKNQRVPAGCDKTGIAHLTSEECKRMFKEHNWIPFAFYKSKYGVARKFYCEG